MLIECYTDGSACVQGVNKGKGGFATYFPELLGKRKAFSAGFTNTKTGRMEITALLYAIRAIPLSEKCTLKVHSDSEYVVKSFTEKRLEKWVSNNWITYNYKGVAQDVKNVDLWQQVIEALKIRVGMDIVLQHIKAHQIDKEKDPKKVKELLKNKHILGNSIADRLAFYKRFENFKVDIK
tara:strand:- start:3632 stop:4171 length:540 start_codon:yes stop_codon:yes gene_type:complete